LNDWSNATNLASLFEILGKWNIDLTAKDNEINHTINADGTLEIMSIDIADACI
jgi:hypothetical protein